jgi:hypothetical protein
MLSWGCKRASPETLEGLAHEGEVDVTGFFFKT